MGDQLTIYLALAHPSGNEQAILRAKVNDDYRLTLGFGDSFLWRRRQLTGDLLGNLQIGGDLNIAAGGYPVALFWGFFRSGSVHLSKITTVIYYRQGRMVIKSSLDIKHQIELGISVLERGGLVAFPTDTVYGLGAGANMPQAVERVYKVKGRPLNMALPLLLADIAQIGEVAQSVPLLAWRLADKFLPGALTMVLYKSSSVSDVITGGGSKIAVRIPAHPIPVSLIRGLGMPLIGTSANLSGKPSALTAAEVLSQFGDRIELVIDGGRCLGGRESTVVDVTGEMPLILREGAISVEELKKVCREIVFKPGGLG